MNDEISKVGIGRDAAQSTLVAAAETLVDDPRPEAAYRRKLTQAMVARALRDAAERRTPT